MDVKIEAMKAEDGDAVIEFMKETFFKDEPLNKSLDLGECKQLEHYCRKGVDSGLSFKALDGQTGQLIGAVISVRVNREQPPTSLEELEFYKSHEKFYKIMEISEYAFERIDLFGRYPRCTEIVMGEVMAVHPSYRGQGIATKLVDATEAALKAAGAQVFYIQCSNHYLAKAAIKFNYTEVFSIAYKTFKRDGVQTLNPEPPHDELKVFIKWIGEVPK